MHPPSCCCSSQTDPPPVAMGLWRTEPGLSSGGGLLSAQRATRQERERPEVDYDAEVSSLCRPQRGQAARKRLLRAARGDDAPTALQLVAEGADLTDVGEALRLAAFHGSACVVRELVAVGLPVNEPCPAVGLTSLQLAAGGGHILVCELLLDAMADVQPGRGPAALILARRKGHSEVEEVIERHLAALVACREAEEGLHRRAHVLPRVSPVVSEAVLQAQLASAREPDAAGGESVEAKALPSVEVAAEIPEALPL